MKILGIDCGLGGSLAVLDLESGKADVYDTPVTSSSINGKKRLQYLPAAMAKLVHEAAPDGLHTIRLVILEVQQCFGIEGKVAAFSNGLGYGIWLGVMAAFGLPTELVKPSIWKQQMLLGRDKDQSRQRAAELFPTLVDKLKRKKDDGRAEALLLCEFARRLWK